MAFVGESDAVVTAMTISVCFLTGIIAFSAGEAFLQGRSGGSISAVDLNPSPLHRQHAGVEIDVRPLEAA